MLAAIETPIVSGALEGLSARKRILLVPQEYLDMVLVGHCLLLHTTRLLFSTGKLQRQSQFRASVTTSLMPGEFQIYCEQLVRKVCTQG